MDKQRVLEIVAEASKQMPYGHKVFISPKPDTLAIGTLETEHGTIHMAYDPMLPPDSFYLMSKDDYDNRAQFG